MPLDRWVNPALLIVDMQNDFVRKGAPMEVPDAQTTLPQHRDLLGFCRKTGIPIIYTKFVAGPKRTLMWEWSPQLEPPIRACQRGYRRYYDDVGKELDCTDIVDEIYPAPSDYVVEKYGYGAFSHTNLEDILRSLHVESLVVTGTVTQICVEETAREAFHHGYRTTIVADAVSSYLPDLHASALKNFALKYGWVSPTAEVLQALAVRHTPVAPPDTQAR
jgi:nicotinamidase-related amidase